MVFDLLINDMPPCSRYLTSERAYIHKIKSPLEDSYMCTITEFDNKLKFSRVVPFEPHNRP